MLIACSRCGRIHERGQCPRKRETYRSNGPRTEEQKFRSGAAWQRMAAEIKRRDASLCKLCSNEGAINGRDLSIHHIEPISRDPDRKLDSSNLITLCREHHALVEGNPAYNELLFSLAKTPPGKLLPDKGK